MPFQITDFVEFDTSGRAVCPSCALDGKTTKKNLSVLATGAYKCHRGCNPEQIRGAIGAEKPSSPPPQTQPSAPAAKVLVSPAKVKQASESLLNQSTHALRWLADRGITPEMIAHYRLGVARCKVGDSSKPSKSCHLHAVSIPIPNADGTAYFQKKRVAPWLDEGDRPDGYQAWSQYGIPQMVYTTHQPEQPSETWLCEGEWDAIALGWAVRHSSLKNDIQVSCFTCGAGNVPPEPELERLAGDVVVFYDHDAPGEKGAAKVAARLKDRCRVATVPATGEDIPEGWDISDALSAGLFDQVITAATNATPWQAPPGNNPLRSRLITNDELLKRAPDYTDWLVDDLLTADELFLLAASPRAGKSLLAMTLAKAVATGGRFLGRPVSKGAVLYIRCEDSETKTKEREIKQGWEAGLPVYWLDKFKLSELAHLEELVEELGVRLVVLDTLSRIRDSAISESSAEMSQLLEPLQEMCKRQRCAGLLVHHTGKVNLQNAGDVDVFDTIRGSSAIRATCRGTLILAADERNYRLAVENGWGKLDLQIILDANTLEWRLLGNWMGPNVDLNQKDRVLAFMNQVASASIDQIAEATNLPKKSLYEVLKRLQCEDLIEKRGEQRAAVYVRSTATQIELLEKTVALDVDPEDPVQQPPEGGAQIGTLSAQIVTQAPVQQVQHVELVLNSQNPDGVRAKVEVQQLPISANSPEKVINLEKSDQKNDHFSEEGVPPTPVDLLNSEPKPLQDKGLQVQQKFNTSSTRVQRPEPTWVYCTELETAVRLDKRGIHASTVYVPGLGSQQFNNEFLQPLETPSVELGGEADE
ncbi:AAA family ATPase [Nodosilinea sp. LEGE 06152]|uniref:AAA family ATPase n=1 Tax=Nodosilinea sp. LEGE 06152 TaxID=2777966 RepID=UPI001883083A|nr:AAA family ATPase [Nodosilinea sp. LEGE 06152]MBE9155369.1 AAA family ATPase [Nodosilinea sp. LEGE 06152]